MKVRLGTHACERSGQEGRRTYPSLRAQRSGFLTDLLDVQPMHFPVEGVAADAELACEVADVAMLEVQLPEQGLAFRHSERIERIHPGRVRRRLRGPRAK